jgi:hypothetical protein
MEELTEDRDAQLRLRSVTMVVWEARAKGSDGEGSVAWPKSNDEEGNASMHGK